MGKNKEQHPVDTFHHDMTLPNGTMVGRRRREGEVSLAFIRPLKEGKPLSEDQELVSVRPSEGGCPRELRLESLGTVKEPAPIGPAKEQTRGPARVTTPAYRSNFDGIFGTKPRPAVC